MVLVPIHRALQHNCAMEPLVRILLFFPKGFAGVARTFHTFNTSNVPFNLAKVSHVAQLREHKKSMEGLYKICISGWHLCCFF